MRNPDFIADLEDFIIELVEKVRDAALDPDNASVCANDIASVLSYIRGIDLAKVEVEALELRFNGFAAPDDNTYELCDLDTRLSLGYPPTWFPYDKPDNEVLKDRKLIWIDKNTLKKEAAERKAKQEAAWAAERERTRSWLNDDERLELNSFARIHGRMWKSKLRKLWQTKKAGPILQKLAKARYFGPDGLTKFKVAI